ncbi:Uncharacterised protein [Vibrio cholerae]|nr:Uncharacterised protein [Vibrio cholerae]CSC62102.1 Uncharacterised protein [Vibrio cholerae]CSI71932.1 Uncharacterised protein [Vibrio cholerae]
MPLIAARPYEIPIAPATAPRRPSKDASRASPCRFKKRGAAVTAKIPRITITTTNSIRVKPPCLFIITISLSCEYAALLQGYGHATSVNFINKFMLAAFFILRISACGSTTIRFR